MSKSSNKSNTGSILFAVFHLIFIVLMFGGFYEYFMEIYVGGLGSNICNRLFCRRMIYSEAY